MNLADWKTRSSQWYLLTALPSLRTITITLPAANDENVDRKHFQDVEKQLTEQPLLSVSNALTSVDDALEAESVAIKQRFEHCVWYYSWLCKG